MAVDPHFDVPFRYDGTAPVVNEQDSLDDIAACVYAVAVTEPGTRDEMPDFGLADPTFGQGMPSAAVIQSQISEWEPRVQVLVDVAPDRFDAAIANADIRLEVKQ